MKIPPPHLSTTESRPKSELTTLYYISILYDCAGGGAARGAGAGHPCAGGAGGRVCRHQVDIGRYVDIVRHQVDIGRY